jgi:hypothetical protein
MVMVATAIGCGSGSGDGSGNRNGARCFPGIFVLAKGDPKVSGSMVEK